MDIWSLVHYIHHLDSSMYIYCLSQADRKYVSIHPFFHSNTIYHGFSKPKLRAASFVEPTNTITIPTVNENLCNQFLCLCNKSLDLNDHGKEENKVLRKEDGGFVKR